MMIYVSHLFEDEKMKELLKEYPCGIETIEFSIGNSLDQLDESIAVYRERMGKSMEDRELSLHGPFLDLCPCSYDSAIREATLLRFNQCYEAAKRLGAKRVIYHTCFYPNIYYPFIWKENATGFFKEFLNGKDESIAIHLENVFEEEYSYMRDLVREVNHPAFSICLDIGHVNCYSPYSVKEWIMALAGEIGHVHIHNNGGDKDSHQSLDQGSISMEEILTLLEKECKDANWTIEVNHYEEAVASLQWLAGRKKVV